MTLRLTTADLNAGYNKTLKKYTKDKAHSAKAVQRGWRALAKAKGKKVSKRVAKVHRAPTTTKWAGFKKRASAQYRKEHNKGIPKGTLSGLWRAYKKEFAENRIGAGGLTWATLVKANPGRSVKWLACLYKGITTKALPAKVAAEVAADAPAKKPRKPRARKAKTGTSAKKSGTTARKAKTGAKTRKAKTGTSAKTRKPRTRKAKTGAKKATTKRTTSKKGLSGRKKKGTRVKFKARGKAAGLAIAKQ